MDGVSPALYMVSTKSPAGQIIGATPCSEIVHASLADLEAFVVALDKPPQDFSPLFNRLSAVDAALAGLQGEVREASALRPIERRLASLGEALGSMPGPDFAPVLNAVRAIDNRNDLVAVENRLTALEYSLAALLHMMRSRPDGGREQIETRVAPPLQVVRSAEASPAPARPDRADDPINPFLRVDDQSNLLTEPAYGVPDDLERIAGVGPMLRSLLLAAYFAGNAKAQLISGKVEDMPYPGWLFVIRAYRSIQKKTEFNLPSIEELAAMEDKGTLERYARILKARQKSGPAKPAEII